MSWLILLCHHVLLTCFWFFRPYSAPLKMMSCICFLTFYLHRPVFEKIKVHQIHPSAPWFGDIYLPTFISLKDKSLLNKYLLEFIGLVDIERLITTSSLLTIVWYFSPNLFGLLLRRMVLKDFFYWISSVEYISLSCTCSRVCCFHTFFLLHVRVWCLCLIDLACSIRYSRSVFFLYILSFTYKICCYLTVFLCYGR